MILVITGCMLPWTCMVVLSVSMGMRKMRKMAAAAEAPTVLTIGLVPLSSSTESKIVMIPVLAAVSPKRERGPCTRAGSTPR